MIDWTDTPKKPGTAAAYDGEDVIAVIEGIGVVRAHRMRTGKYRLGIAGATIRDDFNSLDDAKAEAESVIAAKQN